MKRTQRWWVLAFYSVAAGLTQLLWLNFAPILSTIQNKYSISESQASLLILVFPLIYVALSLPAGAYIDRVGYRKGSGFGVVLMAVFSVLRIFDQHFGVLLIGQIGIAIAQPFVINGISKLVIEWFRKEESAIATGLGTVGMFMGMALGMALTPPLTETFGFHGAMIIFAVMSIFTTVLFFAFVRSPQGAHAQNIVNEITRWKDLFRNKNLITLFILSFLGLGFFNGLTTWLELILAPHGISSFQAGVAGGVLILGGIVGAALIPALSDKLQKRKPFVVGSIAMAALSLYPLCNASSYTRLLPICFVSGFFFLPAFSFLLEMCSEIVGDARAASATGVLMLAGNAGGVLVVMAMEWVKGEAADFTNGVHLLFILLVVSLGFSLTLPETRHG